MSTWLVIVIIALAVIAVAAAGWWFYRKRRTGDETFEGTYRFGWEVSAFIPGDPSKTSPRFWLTWAPDSGFVELLRTRGYDPSWTPGFGTVATKFVGKLEQGAEHGYGHMGQYSAQVTVLRVIEMSQAELETQ